jgi:alkylation response protein AidB-like acyl-CoA dehydrogenase
MSPEAGRFRAEVREWLRAHVPAGPLPSVDTAEGFARHRAWERELAAARLSVVSWPPEYGGRGASLLEWLVFEEEYHAAAAPVRVGQNGLSYAAASAAAAGAGDLGLRAAAAKAYCSETLARVAGEMIQLHGAIGITWEHDAHRYFKRAHGAAQLFGTPSEHIARIAAAVIDG